MQRNESRLWLGAILIVIGALILLHEMRIFYIDDEIVVAAALFIGGLAMLSGYRRTRQVYKLILGIIALFIAVIIYLNSTYFFARDLMGSIVLWMFGAAFLLVYLSNRNQWWAIIPGGVLLTIGSMTAIDELRLMSDEYSGAIFFLGLAVTFGALYLLRDERNKLGWAAWPALATLGFSIFLFANAYFYKFDDFILPIILIGIGLLIVFRSLSAQRRAQNGSELTAQNHG